jgi:drug/metabolite transporter (DMT)-like permease
VLLIACSTIRPASRAGVFTVMLPLAAAAVGVLVLGERVGAMHLVALALAVAVAGLLLATSPVRTASFWRAERRASLLICLGSLLRL